MSTALTIAASLGCKRSLVPTTLQSPPPELSSRPAVSTVRANAFGRAAYATPSVSRTRSFVRLSTAAGTGSVPAIKPARVEDKFGVSLRQGSPKASIMLHLYSYLLGVASRCHQ